MTNLELAHAVFDAAEAGDFSGFRSHFADHAVVWHNFDDRDQPVDETITRLKALGAIATRREYAARRYIGIPGGVVAQHTVRRHLPSGDVITIHAMLRIYIAEGKVTRIEEYLAPMQT